MKDDFTTPLDGSLPKANGLLDFSAALRKMEATTQRQCAGCGETFKARGLVAYCTVCGAQSRDEKPKRTFALDASWPSRHVSKIPAMRGRGADIAARLAPKWSVGGRLLVLAGDRGRGKTQIATFMAHWRGQNGYRTGLYARAFDACSSVVGFDREAKLLRFQTASFLALDECHRLKDEHLPVLESIVDDRYANERPTVLIGNWTTEEGQQYGELGQGNERYSGLGSSLISRLNEMALNQTGGTIWCASDDNGEWPNYREETNAKLSHEEGEINL